MVGACTVANVKACSHGTILAGTSEGVFGDLKDSLCAESVAESWWVGHWRYMGQPVTHSSHAP